MVALLLAGLSVLIGQYGHRQVTSEPEHPISFVVEDGLPYGITQESVEAAAQGRALSREPFTMMVVERELEWDEYQNGQLPDGVDVMLSVGHDPQDEDIVLPDARRVSVAHLAQLDDWMPHHQAASTIREVFINNRTMGHGPSAVVGAGQTAAMVAFDGSGIRSPVFWGAMAAIPLLTAVLLTLLWIAGLAAERRRRRRFARARLQLARTVLELDTLEVEFLIAESQLQAAPSDRGAEAGRASSRLKQQWEAVRAESLSLARQEQVLHRELIDPDAPVRTPRDGTLEPVGLERFEERVEALRRRADALMHAASVQVGFADSGTVLGQLALPLVQAVEEILRHRELLDEQACDRLEGQRTRLLALVQEGVEGLGAEPGPERVAAQADLLRRWRAAEKRIGGTLRRLGDSLQRRIDNTDQLHQAVEQRMRTRLRAVTAGASDTQAELRASLGLGRPGDRSAEYCAERMLELLQRAAAQQTTDEDPSNRRSLSKVWNRWFTLRHAGAVGAGIILLPILVGLIAGWAASAQGQHTTVFGRTLTGDQPLAELRVFGDPGQIPDYAFPPTLEDHPSNQETVTLDYVRERMERAAERDDVALLPDRLELTVVLLPIEDYIDYRQDPERENGIMIDYWDLLDAYQQIRQEVAAEHPEVINSVTGEIQLGQAILPVWLLDDGGYAVGLPLTGEISAGLDSRLGEYYFLATEPVVRNVDDESPSIPLGSLLAYDLTELGRTMEYNHQEAAAVSPEALFWAVAVAGWTGSQTVLLVLVAAVQAIGQWTGARSARRQLAAVRDRLNGLAMGLDLSRIDMVAVLGGERGSLGDAAEADQRLYEAALVTAWREAQLLESLPRRQQRGPEWAARVAHVDRLVQTLSEREADVAQRALELVRS